MTKAIAGMSAELESIGVDLLNSNDELDRLDWTNDETKTLPDEKDLIEPFGWKILVMPMRPRSVTKGGILIPQTRQDTDQYLNYVGRIAALGPLCWKLPRYGAMGMTDEHKWKRGDWIIYPIYQYARIDFKGTKLILLNDDSGLARVPKGVSPWDFKLER
jgi:co-chaperonin GroES (HSP10)